MLQTVSCPSCFALMFRGSQYCPHCGARAVIAETSPGGMEHSCPRCHEPGAVLQPLALGKERVEECAHCGGLWVDCATVERICRDAETQAAVLQLPPPGVTPVVRPVRYLKCPCCLSLMNRKSFAHGCGVIIEVCKLDGAWFDRDDLRRVIEFIRAGGLTRARHEAMVHLEEMNRQAAAQSTPHAYAPIGYSRSDGSDGSTAGFLADVLLSLFT